MIPVEQRQLADLSKGQRGDCLNACVASVLELPYEQVPFFNLHGDDWWSTLVRFLRSHGYGLWHFGIWGDEKPKLMFGSKRIEYHLCLPGHWIAGVFSPRIVESDGTRGLHSIVMRGAELAWDPHPDRELGHLGFNDAFVLIPA